jgi:hypothetical protein
MQPWAHLTSEQPTVILSKNFQPAIMPDSKQLCKTWQEIPSHRNYFVAMGSTVSSFLQQQNEGLAEMVDWTCTSRLVQSHERGRETPILHAQKLQSTKNPSSNNRIRSAILSYRDGCFVFGNDSEKACRERLEILKSNTQQIKVCGPASQTDKVVSASPCSASDTSVEISTDSDADLVTGSSTGSSQDSRHSMTQLSTIQLPLVNRPPLEPSTTEIRLYPRGGNRSDRSSLQILDAYTNKTAGYGSRSFNVPAHVKSNSVRIVPGISTAAVGTVLPLTSGSPDMDQLCESQSLRSGTYYQQYSSIPYGTS